MPAKSKAQQRLFGMVYAVRKDKLDDDDVGGDVKKIANSKMTTKTIKKFAKTKHKNLPDYVKEKLST